MACPNGIRSWLQCKAEYPASSMTVYVYKSKLPEPIALLAGLRVLWMPPEHQQNSHMKVDLSWLSKTANMDLRLSASILGQVGGYLNAL